jgi:hypothetical protein
MSQNNPKIYAALAMGGLALALSIHTAVRGRADAKPTGSSACIDQEARGQADKLGRALVERDAVIARLERVVNASRSGPGAIEPPSPLSSPPPSKPATSGIRRYSRFEIPNPAVSITQKDDGAFDIQTSDPSLVGSVIQVTAVTQSGDADEILFRIMQ